jgi:Fe-S cluster assembly ATPase SufC
VSRKKEERSRELVRDVPEGIESEPDSSRLELRFAKRFVSFTLCGPEKEQKEILILKMMISQELLPTLQLLTKEEK